jgi:hypothetical protein
MLALLLRRLAGKGRKAVEQSVGDGACMKQVFDRPQHSSVLHKNTLSRLIY